MKHPSFVGCHDHKDQSEEKLCGFHHVAIKLAAAFLKSLVLLINRRKGLKIPRPVRGVRVRFPPPAFLVLSVRRAIIHPERSLRER